MTLSTLLLFVVSSFVLAITPGPTMLLALTNGITGGLRVALYGIAGATLASALLIGAVALGMGALLLASEVLFEVLRWLGVAYLVWVGIKLWKGATQPANFGLATAGPDAGAAAASRRGPREAFLRSATVALSNPKAVLFFSAFLPQFIDPAQAQAPQYLVLGMIFLTQDAVVMLAYAAAGTRAVRWLSDRGLALVNRTCAVAMFLLAALLALARRSNA